jgi:hypothetical protein
MIDMKDINKRRETLKRANLALKEHFVGLDYVIDRITSTIEAWYVFNDCITSPLIVNLWGMTGVGKTDLVRRLVQELGISDKYFEVQMEGGEDSPSPYKPNSITEILGDSSINQDDMGVILLDEMQRFRTVGENGSEITSYKFQDIWTLLSDGKMSAELGKRDAIMKIVCDFLYDLDREEARKKHEASKPKKVASDEDDEDDDYCDYDKYAKYKSSYWSLINIKKELDLSCELEEMMMMSKEDLLKITYEKLEQCNNSVTRDYSKVLIFISGNLDEAYGVSSMVSNCNIDADIVYDLTSNINLINIKESLVYRFKPEQIARFGNNHIIYRSLRAKHFKTIIDRKFKSISDSLEEKVGVTVEFDQTVSDLVYRNGVFPVQGVRPLISTISGVVESNLPNLVLYAFENDVENIYLYCENDRLCANINGTLVRSEILYCDIDKIGRDPDEDEKALVSVHEAGHAVTYMILNELVPREVKASLVGYTRGYVWTHDIYKSKTYLRNECIIALAGRVAEEIVFGAENAGIGAYSDLKSATSAISGYVRKYAFDESSVGVYGDPNGSNFINRLTSYEDTDERIEKIIAECLSEARSILSTHKSMLLDIAIKLNEKQTIEKEELIEIASSYKVSCTDINTSKTVYSNYSGMLKQEIVDRV